MRRGYRYYDTPEFGLAHAEIAEAEGQTVVGSEEGRYDPCVGNWGKLSKR